MKKETKINILIAWDWFVENKWVFALVIVGLVVNFAPTEMILKVFLFLVVAAAVSWLYYVVRLSYLKRKLLKLTKGVIDENDAIKKELKSKSAQIKYLQGKPVTFLDKEGNLRTVQKGHDDNLSTMN